MIIMEDMDLIKDMRKVHTDKLVKLANMIDLYAFTIIPTHLKQMQDTHGIDPDEGLPLFDTPHEISNILRELINIQWEENHIPGGIHYKDGKLMVELSS